MDLYEVFNYPFLQTGFIQEIKENYKSEHYRFKTTEIDAETNKEELYVICKLYLDNTINKFKRHTIENEAITESSFGLYVEKIEDDDLVEKHIYSMFYNNEKQEISHENKYNENYDINGIFRMLIKVNCYVFYETEYDYYDENNIVKKSIKEEDCVVCYENKSNILFTDCFHICLCLKCYDRGNFVNCPLCRKKLNNKKILI